MSMYQLETRASNLTEISIILTLRPHWDRGPRRIKLPGIINENGDASRRMILHSCWKQGQIQAESLIPGGRETLAKCGLDKSFNILAPFGKSLVNAPDTTDAFEPEPNLFRPSPDETNAPDPEPFYDADGDIEDAMAIENPRNKNHSPHIIVDGKKLSKASILSQLMQGRSVCLSRDRIRRIVGIPALKQSTSCLITTDESLGVAALRIGNPIVAPVACEEKIFLAVGQVNRIIAGSQDTDSIVLELLSDARTRIPSRSYDFFLKRKRNSPRADTTGVGHYPPKRSVQMSREFSSSR
ncbi:hypothetical protein C8J57DRAFT_1222557 [Mycena rebaudengoi]|nr:hypothetical protein C8J57DRAFT_1222557 [Mycena rebaudengoi]